MGRMLLVVALLSLLALIPDPILQCSLRVSIIYLTTCIIYFPICVHYIIHSRFVYMSHVCSHEISLYPPSVFLSLSLVFKNWLLLQFIILYIMATLKNCIHCFMIVISSMRNNVRYLVS